MLNKIKSPTRGFITFPNQTIWRVDKTEVKGKLFLQVSTKDADRAATILGKSALRLWIHLMAHKNGFQFGFSPAAVEKAIGLKKDGCKAARRELIDKGYLEHTGGIYYTLHSSPVVEVSAKTPQSECDKYPVWVEDIPVVSGKTLPGGGKCQREILKDNKYSKNIIKDNISCESVISFSGNKNNTSYDWFEDMADSLLTYQEDSFSSEMDDDDDGEFPFR